MKDKGPEGGSRTEIKSSEKKLEKQDGIELILTPRLICPGMADQCRTAGKVSRKEGKSYC